MLPTDFKKLPNTFAFTCDNGTENDMFIEGDAMKLIAALVIHMHRHPAVKNVIAQAFFFYNTTSIEPREASEN